MRHKGHGLLLAIGEDFVGNLVDEEVEACRYPLLAPRAYVPNERSNHTYDQALHLVFSHDFYT
jgi:hypothetical protein